MIKIGKNVVLGQSKSKLYGGKVLQTCKGRYGMMRISLKRERFSYCFGYGTVAQAAFT